MPMRKTLLTMRFNTWSTASCKTSGLTISSSPVRGLQEIKRASLKSSATNKRRDTKAAINGSMILDGGLLLLLIAQDRLTEVIRQAVQVRVVLLADIFLELTGSVPWNIPLNGP